MKPHVVLLALLALAQPARALELRQWPLPDGATMSVAEVPAGSKVRPSLSRTLRTTTAQARAAGAAAAINGAFFNHQDGVSASYLTIDGVEVSDPHRNALLINNPKLKPYLPRIFDRTEFRVLSGPGGEIWAIARHFEPLPKAEHLTQALQAGPRLLPTLQLVEEGFVAYGPPNALGRRSVIRDGIGAFAPANRSALGLKPDGTLVLVAVVGAHGTGLSISGLRDELLKLGCREAMALDGGSSTTLVVGEKTIAPPEGEARVRSVLGVLARP